MIRPRTRTKRVVLYGLLALLCGPGFLIADEMRAKRMPRVAVLLPAVSPRLAATRLPSPQPDTRLARLPAVTSPQPKKLPAAKPVSARPQVASDVKHLPRVARQLPQVRPLPAVERVVAQRLPQPSESELAPSPPAIVVFSRPERQLEFVEPVTLPAPTRSIAAKPTPTQLPTPARATGMDDAEEPDALLAEDVTAIANEEKEDEPSSLSDQMDASGDAPATAIAEVAPAPMRLLDYPGARELSLMEAVLTAIEFAPEIAILETDVAIREAEVTRQRAQFDWATFVNTTWNDDNTPVGNDLDGAANRLINRNQANSFGLTQENQVGGSVRLGQDLGFRDSNSQFFNPINQANSLLGIEYQQPLFQGAGRQVATSRIEIAVSQANASHEQYLTGLQQHVLGVVGAYWNLLARRGEYAIQKRLYDEALHTATIVRHRQSVDVGPIQAARCEAAVVARQAAVAESQIAIVVAQDDLLRRIFGASFSEQSDLEIVPSDTPPSEPGPLLDRNREVEIALAHRPEIKQTVQSIKQASIEAGVAKNRLLPLLNMTLSASNRGLRGDRDILGAFSDQFNAGDMTYGVGFEYQFPIGNRAAKAEHRQAELRIRGFQQQLEQAVSLVELDVRNAVNDLLRQQQQRELQTEAVRLAERELTVTKQRTELLLDGNDVGPFYVDTLLAAQERLALVQQSLVQATTGYAIAQFELQRANGTLMQARLPGAQHDLSPMGLGPMESSVSPEPHPPSSVLESSVLEYGSMFYDPGVGHDSELVQDSIMLDEPTSDAYAELSPIASQRPVPVELPKASRPLGDTFDSMLEGSLDPVVNRFPAPQDAAHPDLVARLPEVGRPLATTGAIRLLPPANESPKRLPGAN